MNSRTEASRRQTEESATRTDVQKALACQAGSFQHRSQRLFGARDAPIVKAGKKSRPVLTEFEARASGDFDCVRTHLSIPQPVINHLRVFNGNHLPTSSVPPPGRGPRRLLTRRRGIQSNCQIASAKNLL